MTQHSRLLSYSEIAMAMTCWQQWDFAYGGRSAGATLKAKGIAPTLSGGRAWGAAVAAWHANAGNLLASWRAHEALRDSLDLDAAFMAEQGFPLTLEDRLEVENRLSSILDHYIATAEPLPNLTKLEGEIVVAVPSRTGRQSSTRYRFLCYIDGFTVDEQLQWIVEFKLRNALTPVPLIMRQRQPRWYAWARAKQTGVAPTGVLVDERLNEAPKDPRLVKGPRNTRRPSHAKDQLCTAESYVELCHEYDEEPHFDIVEHLRQRQWQQRVPLMFRSGELEDAGRELRDSAKLIRDLDNGELMPVRNASKVACGWCRYKEICAEPGDTLFVDSLFARTVPKRLREPTERTA